MVEYLNSLPAFLNPHDLVELGLYTSRDAAYLARIKGRSPDFIKLGRRVLYPKDSVIQFVELHMNKGSISTSHANLMHPNN